MDRDTMLLKKTEVFVTHTPKDAYRIIRGCVNVYIIPWNKRENTMGKRVKLCEIEAGHSVPGFAWRDSHYNEWRFAFVSKAEGTELDVIECGATLVLKERFLQLIGLDTFGIEGFEGSLVEYYNANKLSDEIFLKRGDRIAPKIAKETFGAIASAVSGEEYIADSGASELYAVLRYVCNKEGIKLDALAQIEENCSELTLPEIARLSRINCREITLEKDWYKGDSGTIIGTLDGHPVACVPCGARKYTIYYGGENRAERLTEEKALAMQPTAYVIRRSLPRRPLGRKDMFAFVRASLRVSDIVGLLILSAACTLIGVLIPKLNQLIYDSYIPLGDENVLVQMCLVIASFMIGNVFISLVQKLQEYRIPCKAGYELQDAIYQRAFELPEAFFRSHGSADMAQRLTGFGDLTNQLISLVLVNGFTLLMSLIYLIQMLTYSGKLTLAGVLMVLVYGLLIYYLSRSQLRHKRIVAENKGEAASKLYQFLGGVDKIRMAGAEEHAVLEYTLPVAREQKTSIRANRISAWISILVDAGSVLFSMVLYYMMVRGKMRISTGAFLAFNTAFGSLTSGVMQFINAAVEYNNLKPQIERLSPFIAAAPEGEEGLDIVKSLQGEILVDHVSFGYSEAQGNVLNDLSLHIKQGEYVALVGPSGCGKSTLLKLLLGFENPRVGRICYDGKNLATLDKHMLRRKIGVVLQNGKLISGSIYDNITITSPRAPMEEVMRVVEDVGLKEDIAGMPMGIHTVLSESGNTISGGQQQRILIARAIFNNPSVLFFDEATSALDNITQALVCRNLETRKMTRVVIAHRLSTVQNCDRIIVIEGGRVKEEGTYEALMANRGLFYQMASRQLAE